MSYVRTLLDSKAALLTSRRHSLATEGGETGMRRASLETTRRALEPALRRVLHAYWRFARAMTLGVRALVLDRGGGVFRPGRSAGRSRRRNARAHHRGARRRAGQRAMVSGLVGSFRARAP